MIILNDLIKAGITIEEKITNVVEYSRLDNIENLSFDDLEIGNYSTYEAEDPYYDNAETYWYIELPNSMGFDLDIEELKNLADNVDTVDEFIKALQEKHESFNQIV